MKNKVFFILSLAILFSAFTACTKSSSSSTTAPTGSYYLKATIGGTTTNYAAYITAVKIDTMGFHTLTVVGLSSLTSANNSFTIAFASPAAITTTSYTSVTTSLNQALGINVIAGHAYSSIDNSSSNAFSASISSLTNTFIVGTFSGVLTDSLNVSKTVTGSFYSPVQ